MEVSGELQPFHALCRATTEPRLAFCGCSVRNNHGGGYSYRLCPATETLSEGERPFPSPPPQFLRSFF
eukprot:COSAG01_NODE_7716_length_3086_cov_5.125544_5_plen_68_part_00